MSFKANRGPGTLHRGAYLSGTCSSGDWVVWTPGNDKTDDDNWFVQKAPASATDWAAGAYMLAGVCYNQGYEPSGHQPVVSIVRYGFTPKGRVVDPGGAILSDGYPLKLGGGVGAAAPHVGGDVDDVIGCALESPGVTTPVTVKCIVRDLS